MSEFKVLSDIEHIRLRIGMYAGSTTEELVTGYFCGEYQTLNVIPALLKVINEVIDNSVDEFIRTSGKFANKIDVKIFQDGLDGYTVSVKDNGRGIPVKKIGDEYQPVLAWTKARAGSNFSDQNRVTAGMNGVGSFITNVCAKEFVGITSDGENKITVTCEKGELKKTKVAPSTEKFTQVTFSPDMEFFKIRAISQDHFKYLEDRLLNLTISYPGISFRFNDKKIEFKNTKSLAKTFSEHTVIAEQPGKIFIMGSTGDTQEFRHLTYVNGLNVKNGGTHVDYFLNRLIDEMRPAIKKKLKIDVMPNQIRQNLFLVSYMTDFPNCKFDSQTKERLTNTQAEISGFLDGFDFAKIAKNILNTEEIINPIVQAILYKKELADRLALARAQKKKKVKIANHIEATSNNPEEKILFITEGLSAIGPLIAVRNSSIHGGYSLKGKVMNVSGMKPVDIIKNKELSELMQIIGLEFGKEATDLNYGTIAIMTDADVDGSAIFCLLVNFFRMWPNLFSERRIRRVITPRYIVTKGKNTQWFYTDAEFAEFNNKSTGYTVNYIKGLGTLNKSAYKEIVNNPNLIQVSIDNQEDIDYINIAFSDSADARKEWMLNV